MAKKAKPEVGHHDDYEYPHFQQFQAAAPTLLKIVTGQAPDLDLNDKMKTLHTGVSFAWGMVFPHDHEGVRAVPGEEANDPAVKELHDEACKRNPHATEGVQGFNWLAMLRMFIEIANSLLNRPQ